MQNVASLLWTIIVILFAVWLIGLFAHFMAGWIWLLFVVAIVLLAVNLASGRGARV